MMIALILRLAGPYAQWTLVYFFELVEMLAFTALYTRLFAHRRYFPLRLAGGLLGSFAAAFLLGMVRTLLPGLMTNIVLLLLLYATVFAFLALCYAEPVSELVFCVCTGMCTWVLVGRLYGLLLILCGRDERFDISLFGGGHELLDWLVYLSFRFLIAFLISLPVCRRDRRVGRESDRLVILFSLGITVITAVIDTACRYYDTERTPLSFLITAFCLLYGVIILVLRGGILEQSRRKQELSVLEELLRSEKRQYDDIRSEMDLINMKCHDLRHQLADLQGRLTEEELSSLSAAVELYDANSKTGCDILDMILFKKRLYCQQNRITVTCVADGSCLARISHVHLYSLLSNAVENAITAAGQVKDPDKRLVSVAVGREGALAAIHVTNYFSGQLALKDGLPATSKEEGHHGYGFKSMRYIAGLYQGDVSFRIDGDSFCLDIFFPLEETAGEF